MTVTMSRIGASLFVTDLFGHLNIRTRAEYSVDMIINKDFHGDFFLYILGYDSENSYTERLETHIYVFWSPCVHGICSPKFNNSPPCDDVSRATSFDFFKCSCFPGYTGEWCENEIDECLQQPCGEVCNCIDKVNSYECEIKTWIVIIIIVILVVFIGPFIIIIYVCVKVKKKKNDSNQVYPRRDVISFSEYSSKTKPFSRTPCDNKINS